MEADEAYSEYLDKLADTHSDRLSAVFDTLEERIAEALDSAPVKAGKLFDLEYAVNARTEIKDILEDVYSREVNSILKDYKAVAGKTLGMLNEYGDFTQVDPAIIRNLQKLSFRGFEDIASSHLDIMATEVYQNTLTGRTRAEMVKSVRQSINGVYIKSNEAEINALVAVAKNGTAAQAAAAVDKLHRVYSADRVGNNMRRYSTQMVQDSLMQFDASINTAIGVEAGIDTWKYYGDLIKDSRQFCKTHAGKVYTTDEINEIWQGSWAGKSSSDGLISRGGYNCRHHFRPYLIESEGEVEEAEPKKSKPKPAKLEAKGSAVIKIIKATEAKKRLDKILKKASESKQYPNISQSGLKTLGLKFNHRGVKGKSESRKDFADRAMGLTSVKGSDGMLSIVSETLTELEGVAIKYKIPPIRSVGTIKNAKSTGANMGDGVLGLNVSYFEQLSSAKFSSKIDIEKQIVAKRAKIVAAESARVDALENYNKANGAEKTKFGKLHNKERAKIMKLNNEIDKLEEVIHLQDRTAPSWTLGDDVANIPSSVAAQIKDPSNMAKAIIEHEFGHQIHQQWGVNGSFDVTMKPPIEKWLKSIPRKDRVHASKYAATNEHEWFAEAFSAYSRGRIDLVDPKLFELFEALGDDSKVKQIIGL